MNYVVFHGSRHQTISRFARFEEALPCYRAHLTDRDGARIINEDRSDGESDGLTEVQRDQVDAVDHPRLEPAPFCFLPETGHGASHEEYES